MVGGRGGSTRQVCKYFSQASGCRKGERCNFQHVRDTAASNGGGSKPSNSWKRASGNAQMHAPPEEVFRRIIRFAPPLDLGRLLELLRAATSCLDAGDEAAQQVVRSLGASANSDDDHALAHVQQAFRLAIKTPAASLAQQQVQEVLQLVLRVSSHRTLTDSLQEGAVNTYLSRVKGWLNEGNPNGWAAVKSWLQSMLPTADTGVGLSVTAASSSSASWLDAVQSVAALLQQLLDRFQRADDFKELEAVAKGVAGMLRQAYSTRMHAADLQGIRAGAKSIGGMLDAIDSLLEHGTVVRELLTAREAAQQRARAAAAATAAQATFLQELRVRDPNYLPGDLRPAGPRHDNDRADYTAISVVPTPQELLCEAPPYLPPNRPGGIPHMDSQPVRARLECHFRLLRHDVVGPLVSAVQDFKKFGGIKELQKMDKKGRAGRLRISDSMLYTFRKVKFEGVASSPRGYTYHVVSFEPPAALEQRKTPYERKMYWEASRRLAHGTLCVLWTEPPERAQPMLMLAVVAERRTEDLVKARPQLGLRLFEGAGSEALMAFVTAGAAAQGEIILIQENNAFFAYEPVLHALQAAHARITPLDKYLATSASAAADVGHTRRAVQIDLPAYLMDMQHIDLSRIIDTAKLAALDPAEQARVKHVLSHVVPSTNLDAFPIQELLAATTLDAAQARALACALMREVAVVQGPPGTGKTFLGVKLMAVLLDNLSRSTERNAGILGIVLQEGEGVGPVLVVCFTNHALDSFLEGLLDAGIENIVRVGSEKKVSDRLKPKCLSVMQERARGRSIAMLMQKKEALAERLKGLSMQLVEAAQQRSLPAWQRGGCDLVEEVLGAGAVMSFVSGARPWTDGYEDDWTYVHKGKSRKLDLLQEWLAGSPSTDWAYCRLPELLSPVERMVWEECGGDYGMWQEVGPHLLQALTQGAWTGAPPVELQAFEASQRPLEQIKQAVREGLNVWHLSKTERMWLAHDLARRRYNTLVQETEAVSRSLQLAQKSLQAEYDQAALSTLKRAQVVGMTTSGVAQRKELVTALAAKIVMVEEAAEVFEAHVLVCLSKYVQHLILIGDHEQLRPKPNLWELQAASNRQLDLDISLFERLVTQQGFPLASLAQQRRMRPEISRLLLPIYPHLRDHDSVRQYPSVMGMIHPLYFFDHDHPEQGKDEGRSKSNAWEAKFSVALARYLMQQGYHPEDIVIITPYVGQLFCLRNELQQSNMTVVLSERDKDDLAQAGLADSDEETEVATPAQGAAASSGTSQPPISSSSTRPPALPPGTTVITQAGRQIRVATIDNFQGEEGKIIILSLTRNNKEGNIGFLKMRNRICVMISRAQHGMYILGNADSLRANAGRAPMWPQVLDTLEAAGCVGPTLQVCCQRHKAVTHVSEVDQFHHLVGDGGCQLSCGEMLPCGHLCPRRCHADDPQHVTVKCHKPCDRLMQHCNHPCPKLCHQECGKCMQIIPEVSLPCGHKAANVQCWRQYETGAIQCSHTVQVQLPCGHQLSVACHKRLEYEAGLKPCTKEVEVTLPLCGHTMKVACGERIATLVDPTTCKQLCGKKLPCDHDCPGHCGACVAHKLKSESSPFIDSFLASIAGVQWSAAWTEQDAAARAGRAEYSKYQRWVNFMQRNTEAGSAFTSWLKGRLQPTDYKHSSCNQPCDRNLSCGHACALKCHGTSPCPPCRKPCWMGCSHSTCKKPCGDPCIPCAGSCVWRCPHRGACTAPCGAPCDRLPCDLRCERMLPCGHRSPGLCGESCPAQLCVHPSCMARMPDKLKDQVVDMIMQTTMGMQTDDSVTEDPLVMLSCGHVLTVSTLDGIADMNKFYEREGATWVGVKELPAELDKPPTCPSCREPIRGVLRCGRIVNKAALDLVDRKHMDRSDSILRKAQEKLDKVRQEQQGNGSGLQVKAALRRIKQLDGARDSFQYVCDQLDRFPKQRVYEAALSRLQKHIAAEAERSAPAPTAPADMVTSEAVQEGGDVSMEQADGSRDFKLPAKRPSAALLEGQEHGVQDARRRAAAAAEARACGVASGNTTDTQAQQVAGRGSGSSSVPMEVHIAMDASSSKPAGDVPSNTADSTSQEGVQESQLQAAFAARLSVLDADYPQLHQARAGMMAVVQLQLEVVKQACQQATTSASLRGNPAASAGRQAGRNALLESIRKMGRQAQDWFKEFMGTDSMPAAAAAGDGILRDTSRSSSAGLGEKWVQEAVRKHTWSKALLLMEQRMCLQLTRVQQLQQYQRCVRSLLPDGVVGSSTLEEDKQLLLHLLEQVVALEGEAQQVLASWQHSVGDPMHAAALVQNAMYLHIQQMASDAEQYKKKLQEEDEDAQMLQVLAAVAQAEGGGSDAVGYMRGHLNRCPNGHLYVIANCGGALQEARCSECGARIGGQSYQLHAGNQRATDVAQRLQQLRGRAAA